MKLKLLLLSSVLVLASMFVLAPQLVAADAKSDICAGIGQTATTDPATNQTTCGSSGSQLTSIANTIVNILSIVVGVAAVIMIIVAGYKYIVAGGDSGKVTSAKNTLIYAIVGLIIASLAQLIVHTVLTTSDKVINTCPTNSALTTSDPNCK